MKFDLSQIIWFIILFNFVYNLMKKQSQGGDIEELEDLQWRGELGEDEDINRIVDVSEADLRRWQSRLGEMNGYINGIQYQLSNLPQFADSLRAPLSLFFNENRANFNDLKSRIQEGVNHFEDLDSRSIYRDFKALNDHFKGLNQYLETLSRFNPTVWKTADRLIQWIWKPLDQYGYAVSSLNQLQWGFISPRAPLFQEIASQVKGVQWIEVDPNDFDLITHWPLLARQVMRTLIHVHPQWQDDLDQHFGTQYHLELPVIRGRKLAWDVHESLSFWKLTLLEDLFMSMRFGPLAFKALQEEYEGVSKYNISTLRSDSTYFAGRLPFIPPVRIRFEMILAYLQKQGFIHENTIFDQLLQQNYGSDLYIQTRDEQSLAFPIDALKTSLLSWVEEICSQPWKSWKSESFDMMIDLEMTVGSWKRIQELESSLKGNQTQQNLTEDLRWPTLIEGAFNQPDQSHLYYQLATTVYKDKLSQTSSQKRTSSSYKNDLIAAIVLPDLLMKRPVQRRSKR